MLVNVDVVAGDVDRGGEAEVFQPEVDRVARDSGLGTPANLRLRFRRMLGTTPTAYRRTFTH